MKHKKARKQTNKYRWNAKKRN